MSERDETVPLRQMMEFAEEAIGLMKGKSRTDLEDDRLLDLGLTRLVEMIGDASTRVPAEVQVQLPDIPWTQIRGTRNRLIHAYDFVDFDVVWQTVVEDLPTPRQRVEETPRPISADAARSRSSGAMNMLK